MLLRLVLRALRRFVRRLVPALVWSTRLRLGLWFGLRRGLVAQPEQLLAQGIAHFTSRRLDPSADARAKTGMRWNGQACFGINSAEAAVRCRDRNTAAYARFSSRPARASTIRDCVRLPGARPPTRR